MTIASAPRTTAGYVTDSMGWTPALLDALEYVPELTWPESVRTYARMRNDPQLSGVLASYLEPLKHAKWELDGSGCRDEVVQLVADDFGLPIAGSSDKPGPARRRGIQWDEHLRMALQYLAFGHMPFAERYEFVKGKYRLAELSERMPTTITDFDVDNTNGRLLTVRQFGAKDDIDARHLTWYAHEREGAAWQGKSILRPAYGAWLLKYEMWRVHGTSIRRFGMGIPSVEAPPGALPAQVTQAQQLASAMRAGDQSGIGLPPGFKLNVTGITGSTPDALGFIKYLDEAMTRMALTHVLTLGSSQTGSRALGDTFIDLLQMAWNSIAKEVANIATQTVVKLVDYNWGEDEPAPRITCGTVGDDPTLTAAVVSQLIQSGGIQPDPLLDAYLRRHWKMPERDPKTPWKDPAEAASASAPSSSGGGGVPSSPASVEAARAGTHSGAMIALVPSEADLSRLALVGGVPRDELHLTLRYLGKASDIPAEALATISDGLPALTGTHDVQSANGYASHAFNYGAPDAETALVLLVQETPKMKRLYDDVSGLLASTGVSFPPEYDPWLAHVTLVCSDDLTKLADVARKVGSITFDRVRFAVAGEVIDYPLRSLVSVGVTS
jgi:2'-5' RNA ligase